MVFAHQKGNQSMIYLAIDQPTSDPGPFGNIFDRGLSVLNYASGAIALGSLLLLVSIFAYQKFTGQTSSALQMIGGIVALVMIGSAAATIVNWAQSG